MRRYTKGTWAVVIISLVITALFASFVGWRIGLPTEGARLPSALANPIQPDGVLVIPVFGRTSSAFQPYDKVISVDRASASSIARGTLMGSPVPILQLGQRRIYTVMREGRIIDLVVEPAPYPAIAIFTDAWGLWINFTFSFAIALLAFIRKPNELLVRAMMIWVIGLLGIIAYAIGIHLSDFFSPVHYWHWVILTVGGINLFSVGIVRFALTFAPHVSPLLKQLNRPRAVFLTYLLPFALQIVSIAVGWFAYENKLEWLALRNRMSILVLSTYSVLFAGVMTLGYITTTNAETRKKIRLVVYGSLVSILSLLVLTILPAVLRGETIASLNVIGLFGFPIYASVGLAIFRYRLIDIDFVINRTLVYGVLSLLLAIAWFGLLIGFQSLFGRAADTQLFEVVTVLTTLIAVGLFNPMRQRVQAWVDRRFYRSKYAAQQAIGQFTATARSQVDIDKLSHDLQDTVQQAFDAEHISVWMRGDRQP